MNLFADTKQKKIVKHYFVQTKVIMLCLDYSFIPLQIQNLLEFDITILDSSEIH